MATEYPLYRKGKLPRKWSANVPGHYITTRIPEIHHTYSREYQSWRNMIQRCYYRSYIGYHHYGGRGIRVCIRWILGDGKRTGFECYLLDRGRRPEGMTCDRVDSDGHYTPANCRWADARTQVLNRRKNKKVA